MTIKNLYPPNRPASIYNVINGRPELPVSSTFSRASAASYYNAQGLLQTAAAGIPRFNHDPYTGEFLGLMLEDATENRIIKSEFDAVLETATGIEYQTEDMGPLGTVKTFRFVNTPGVRSFGYTYPNISGNWLVEGREYTFSCYIKTPDNLPPDFNIIYLTIVGSGIARDVVTERVAINVWRCHVSFQYYGGNYYCGVAANPFGYDGPDYRISGFQCENLTTTRLSTSYIPTSAAAVGVRSADAFSMTAVDNFDRGFSLLLDSETSTDSFIYKIKASGTEVASLNNDNGTLNWEIGNPPTSAKIQNEYPQVGFVKGRVRTISSFTAAGDTVNPNYLYTKGLSFPTVGAPASGADKLVFGVPQTLKALYVWAGQLDPAQAVSIIKGDQNIVPSVPIVPTKYSFVYDTDTNSDGNVDITLPFIVPTNVSGGMTIDWGDGTPIRPYNKGVIPAHKYPYPGQYRIQVDGNETWNPAGDITGTLTGGGFDTVALGGDVDYVIKKVDAWPPQFRTTASGPGFQGNQMDYLLSNMTALPDFPLYKYSNLDSLTQTFFNCINVPSNGWDKIPVNLQLATSLNSTFYALSIYNTAAGDSTTFPQLQTSDNLKSVNGTFQAMSNIDSFPIGGLPFSNTAKVENWNSCFAGMGSLKSIGALNTNSAKQFQYVFNGCYSLGGMPFITTTNVEQSFQYTWNDCKALADPFPSISLGTAKLFTYTWRNCEKLINFPWLDFSNAESLYGTWFQCYGFGTGKEFPTIDTSNVLEAFSCWFYNNHRTFPKLNFDKLQNMRQTWYLNTYLTQFPEIDFPEALDVRQTWANCSAMTSFPAACTFPKGIQFDSAWQSMTELTSFPAQTFPEGYSFGLTWYQCGKLTSFNCKFPKGVTFAGAWQECTLLADFPNDCFSTTVTFDDPAFYSAWTDCALTASAIEKILSNLNGNSSTGISLSLQGGTNADYKDWTNIAKTQFQGLIDKGWDCDINDSTSIAPSALLATSGFYVNHGDGHFAFGEFKPGVRHSSGKANQEVFDNETEAVERILELKPDYFPKWDRNDFYKEGDRVMIGNRVYRSLMENDLREFQFVDDQSGLEAPSPMNRKARWAEVYKPELNEEESDGGPVQRSA